MNLVEKLERQRTSLEARYATTDLKRLREFRNGKVTKKTEAQHQENCRLLEENYENLVKAKATK
jgi:hypothetical protein